VSQIVKVVAITDRPSEYETLVDLGTYRVIVRWPDGDRDRGMAIARRVAGALQDLEAYLEGGRRRPLVAIARETVLAEVVRLARDLVAPFVAPAEPGEYIGPMWINGASAGVLTARLDERGPLDWIVESIRADGATEVEG
jgi:hypothetical protein